MMQSGDNSPLSKNRLDRSPAKNQLLTRLLVALFLIVLVVGILGRFVQGPLNDRFQTFVTIFMGIFIEAVPFLLAGSIVSGLIAVFVDQQTLARFVPRNAILAALTGSLLGFAFPVCECGVVPVTRRLYQKGLPASVGIAFLLAAPVVNPIVILSTYAAFGWGPVLIGRFIFSILIAFIVGLIFTLAHPDEIMLPNTAFGSSLVTPSPPHPAMYSSPTPSSSDVLIAHPLSIIATTRPIGGRFWQALATGGDDFIDMARYLIVGSMLAAAMQTFVPQSTLLALGSGPVLSVIVLMALAFVLSICSTVDAFLALSFVNSFTTGSILSFLVFGPMVDIKSSLMFLGVFRRRAVLYLILLPLMLALFVGILVNLNLAW